MGYVIVPSILTLQLLQPLYFWCQFGNVSEELGSNPSAVVTLNMKINRTLELLGLMTTLQAYQQRTQNQLHEAEALMDPSDQIEIRLRLAVLEQGVLNLQMHFQEILGCWGQPPGLD